jgi:hypothetical protein
MKFSVLLKEKNKTYSISIEKNLNKPTFCFLSQNAKTLLQK